MDYAYFLEGLEFISSTLVNGFKDCYTLRSAGRGYQLLYRYSIYCLLHFRDLTNMDKLQFNYRGEITFEKKK